MKNDILMHLGNSLRRGAVLTAIAAAVTTASAADWPQYLGPDRNAQSAETGILRAWPEGGPKVLWTIEVGGGFAGPAISGGKVYLLDRVKGKKDVLRCLDLANGKDLWTFEYEAPGSTSFPGSRTVPSVEGDRVFTCGPFGDLYCFNAQTGKPVWSKNIWKDYGGEDIPRWGITQNPLLYGDWVIVAPQTEKAGVAAFDKKTGREVWATPALPGKLGYVSPTLVQVAGEDHVVMVSAGPDPRKSEPGEPGTVMGMDPRTGKELWRYQGWQCRIPIPNVTSVGEDRFFITSGYRAGSALIKVQKQGPRYTVTEVFTTPDFNTHVHPAIYHEGHLYGHGTTNETRDGLTCMDLEGNIKWKTKRDPTFDKGGLILVDGLILSVNGNRNSSLNLIDPSPEGFKLLASAPLLESQQAWAPLAISDGKLIIRDQDQMKCVAIR